MDLIRNDGNCFILPACLPTFASVALPHESPEQLRAVVTIGRLVEVLLDKAVPVLVAQVVVFHGADGERTDIHSTSSLTVIQIKYNFWAFMILQKSIIKPLKCIFLCNRLLVARLLAHLAVVASSRNLTSCKEICISYQLRINYDIAESQP